jgi:hypothetical protein
MVALAFALACSCAQARFLSADPVPASARDMSRYAYARNHPYGFTDPDGRVAIIVHERDGDIAVRFPTRFHGPAATPENIARVRAYVRAMSGSYAIGGRDVRVLFHVDPITARTPTRARNDVLLIAGATPSGEGGRSNAEVGGRRAEIDVRHGFHANGVPAHEFAHLAGLQDLYDRATRKPDPAHRGRLMNELPGRVDAAFIEALLQAPTNIRRRER